MFCHLYNYLDQVVFNNTYNFAHACPTDLQCISIGTALFTIHIIHRIKNYK